MLQLGKITIEPNLILAPMSGVTNSVFRRLIKSENPGAVGLLVTEFISIEGLTRENKQSLRLMKHAQCERPLSIQIFGYDIGRMVDAAQMAQDAGADIVDINSGCPVPRVVRRGGGCELMRHPEHMQKMLTAVRAAISVPLTLKIRTGWDDANRNGLEIAKMAEGCGVEMLAIHGRTRTQMYRGDADWSYIAEVAEALSIPVIGSGDVNSCDSAHVKLQSKIAGLMIGRAALSNPWVFSEINAATTGQKFVRPADSETARILQTYLEMVLEDLPEKAVIGRLKQLASQVTRRVYGSTSVRKALCCSKTVGEFRDILSQWREYLENKGSPADYEAVIVQRQPMGSEAATA